MSILIKGAKMPRHCGYCFFNDFNICQIEHCPVADAVYHEERHEDCPLVEIPTHGRLIDADNLDVEPVRHGHWEKKDDPYGYFDKIPVCSECGRTTELRKLYAYCPNCGAKMDGKE